MFDGEAFGKQMVEIIRDYVDREIEPLKARIAELEKGGVKYLGAYQRAADYRRGDTVTHKGAMWTALGDVGAGETPGDTGTWQLSAKVK